LLINNKPGKGVAKIRNNVIYCNKNVTKNKNSKMAFRIPLTERLNTLMAEIIRREVNSDILLQICRDQRFSQRKIEIIGNDVGAILDELLKQTLIWVEDTSNQGNIILLERILAGIKDDQDLIPLYNELKQSLRNVIQQPLNRSVNLLDIPFDASEEIVNVFETLGWPETHEFLSQLGKFL
jgi:hypothetical protein